MTRILSALLQPALLCSILAASSAFQLGPGLSAMRLPAACSKMRRRDGERVKTRMNVGGGREGEGEGRRRKKVAVIGAGNVGGTTSFVLAMRQLADIVMLDVNEGVAKGKALDLEQAGSLCGFGGRVEGTGRYEDVAMADVVVVTSGMPRKPGMTRDDLVKANADIIGQVAEGVKLHAPDAKVLMVTNPLDPMTYHFCKLTGFEPHRVFGMAGVLDSARLKYFIAQKAGCSAKDVSAMVLGGHGDEMIPLMSSATINGIPVKQLMTKKEIEEICERTANGGGEIVNLLQQGSAFYAPAASIADTVEAILLDQQRVLPCSVLLEGQFGISDVCLGVPAVVGREGIMKVLEIELEEEEKKRLLRNAENTKKVLRTVLGYA